MRPFSAHRHEGTSNLVHMLHDHPGFGPYSLVFTKAYKQYDEAVSRVPRTHITKLKKIDRKRSTPDRRSEHACRAFHTAAIHPPSWDTARHRTCFAPNVVSCLPSSTRHTRAEPTSPLTRYLPFTEKVTARMALPPLILMSEEPSCPTVSIMQTISPVRTGHCQRRGHQRHNCSRPMKGVNNQAVVFYTHCPSSISVHRFHHLVFSVLVPAGRVSTSSTASRQLHRNDYLRGRQLATGSVLQHTSISDIYALDKPRVSASR
jgi:hypothetical protein